MFLYASWLKLDLSVRARIATQFGIPKTLPTHVQDNVVVQDGYKVQDVESALNIDAIQQYIGVEHTDMATLWDLLVAKIEGREVVDEVDAAPDSVVLKDSGTEEIVDTPPSTEELSVVTLEPKVTSPAKKAVKK